MKKVDTKNIIALLPMKGHSERVPGKNFKIFFEKPLFKWTLETLLTIDKISKVIINTDAREIFKAHGLNDSEKVLIRDRKIDIRGDMVSMNKIIKDDLENTDASIYLMTHTTNPLLTASTIINSLKIFIEKYEKGEADSLFTVNKYQTRFYRKDGSPVNHNPKILLRTQDLEPWYEENSNLYIFTKESFIKNNTRIGEKPFLYEMDIYESIDIDDQKSWEMAEKIMRTRELC